jgi:hypothetical protein
MLFPAELKLQKKENETKEKWEDVLWKKNEIEHIYIRGE